MSENNSDLFKPDTEEKIAELQEKLAAADRLISRKNQEISDLNAQLVAANQKISERDDEIEQLESELASRSGEISTSPAPIAIGVESPDSATILSQLRARRKKSPVSLADIEAILEIIEES